MTSVREWNRSVFGHDCMDRHKMNLQSGMRMTVRRNLKHSLSRVRTQNQLAVVLRCQSTRRLAHLLAHSFPCYIRVRTALTLDEASAERDLTGGSIRFGELTQPCDHLLLFRYLRPSTIQDSMCSLMQPLAKHYLSLPEPPSSSH